MCAAISAMAGDAPKKETKKKSTKPAAAKQKGDESDSISLETGTLIPDKVRLAGAITDGPNVVVVYTSDAIKRSGASDLATFLRSRGAR